MSVKKFVRGKAGHLIPLFFGVVCYVLCICFSKMQYMTNDDTSIQNALSGVITGSPFPVHQFIHFAISYPISWIYKLIPGVQWWFVYSQFLTAVSLIIINYCIWYQARNNQFPLSMAACMIVIVDSVFLLYPISNTGFSVVAGYIGAGAAFLLLSGKRHTKARTAIACILFILAVCHRWQSGIVAACYILLSILYVYFFQRTRETDPVVQAGEEKGKKRIISQGLFKSGIRFLIIIFAIIVSILALNESNRAVQNKINGDEFVKYNKARVSYMDYSRDSYQDNPQIFDDVGWSETTFNLVRSWCFMDEKVTTDSFNYLVNHSTVNQTPFGMESITSQWKKLQQDRKTVCIEWVWLIISAGALFSITLKYQRESLFLFLLNVFGTFILFFYQLYIGRIMYRTVIICLLPSTVLNIILLLNNLGRYENRKVCYIVSILITLYCIPFISENISLTYNVENKEKTVVSEEQEKTLEEYTLSHEGNIYIRQNGLTQSLNPAVSRINNKASNIIYWGGSTYNSKANRLQLKSNDIKALSGETLKRDNAYFLSTSKVTDDDNHGVILSEKNLLVLFYNWLKQEHGATGLLFQDTVCEGIYVYKFLFSDPSNVQGAMDYKDGRFYYLPSTTERKTKTDDSI